MNFRRLARLFSTDKQELVKRLLLALFLAQFYFVTVGIVVLIVLLALTAWTYLR